MLSSFIWRHIYNVPISIMEINPPFLLLRFWNLMSRVLKVEQTCSCCYLRTTLHFCWIDCDCAVWKKNLAYFSTALLSNCVQICVTRLSGVNQSKSLRVANKNGRHESPQTAQGQNVGKLTQDSSYQEKPNPNLRHIM